MDAVLFLKTLAGFSMSALDKLSISPEFSFYNIEGKTEPSILVIARLCYSPDDPLDGDIISSETIENVTSPEEVMLALEQIHTKWMGILDEKGIDYER